VLTGLLRSSDIIGRYGGDEFIILLPDTDNTGEVCNKMDRVLTEEMTEYFGISASAGWAQGAVNCQDIYLCLNELISRADHMMYQAKREKTKTE